MAHVSGRSGTVVLGSAGDAIFGPIEGTSVELQAWTLTQETDTFEAFSKADNFVETFSTGTRWSGTMSFLQESAATTAHLVIRKSDSEAKGVAAADFKVNDNDKYEGKIYITRAVTESPLDGPVTYVVDFVGDGVLTFVGA